MSKLVSDKRALEIVETINIVRDLQANSRDRTKRRVRTGGGGGAKRPYLSIKSNVSVNEYVGTVFDNPVDLNIIIDDVVVMAEQPEFGIIATGVKFFADLSGGIYYIQPSVFYGS